MSVKTGKQCSFTPCIPGMFTKEVSHRDLGKLKLGLSISSSRPTSSSSLDIRYMLVLPWLIGWTPLAPGRASPLVFTFLLNDKKQSIHPAPSSRTPCATHDQDACDLIFRCRDKFSHKGDAGRTLPALLVERSGERFDGACKARCIDSGESTQLLFTGVNNALLGLAQRCWGNVFYQIFYSRVRLKNRHSPFIIGMMNRLCSAWASQPSNLASRLKALRVAERNVASSRLS